MRGCSPTIQLCASPVTPRSCVRVCVYVCTRLKAAHCEPLCGSVLHSVLGGVRVYWVYCAVLTVWLCGAVSASASPCVCVGLCSVLLLGGVQVLVLPECATWECWLVSFHLLGCACLRLFICCASFVLCRCAGVHLFILILACSCFFSLSLLVFSILRLACSCLFLLALLAGWLASFLTCWLASFHLLYSHPCIISSHHLFISFILRLASIALSLSLTLSLFICSLFYHCSITAHLYCSSVLLPECAVLCWLLCWLAVPSLSRDQRPTREVCLHPSVILPLVSVTLLLKTVFSCYISLA